MNEWQWLLNDEEWAWCYWYAQKRIDDSVAWQKKNGRPVKNYDAYEAGQKLEKEALGVIGEFCASRVLGIEMNLDTNKRHLGDLQHGIEVRTVDNPSYSLIFNERDKLDRPYVLVLIKGRMATLQGWLRFDEEAKAKGEQMAIKSARGGVQQAWIVKTVHLNPMGTMRTRLDKIRRSYK